MYELDYGFEQFFFLQDMFLNYILIIKMDFRMFWFDFGILID